MKKERLYVPVDPEGEYCCDLACLGMQDAREKVEHAHLWGRDDSSWAALRKEGWRIATFERVS